MKISVNLIIKEVLYKKKFIVKQNLEMIQIKISNISKRKPIKVNFDISNHGNYHQVYWISEILWKRQ